MTEDLKQIQTYLGKFKFELDPTYLIDRIILTHGHWEPHVLSYIDNFVKPGMVVVDVGANVGYHTLLMAERVGSQGRVYAFEPNPDTRNRLLRNLELNPDLVPRVKVLEYGLSNKEEILYVAEDSRPESKGNACLINSPIEQGASPIKVVTLDNFVKEPVSFIKLDVEGMELQVLEGAKEHINNNRPIIVYETLTSAAPETHKPKEDFLKQFGYRILCPTPNGENLIEVSYPMYPYDDCVSIYGKEYTSV